MALVILGGLVTSTALKLRELLGLVFTCFTAQSQPG
jgi:hypothetical protein